MPHFSKRHAEGCHRQSNKPPRYQTLFYSKSIRQSDKTRSLTDHASLADGVEEVFAAAGESVSLDCRGNSSLVGGGNVMPTESKHSLTGDIASQTRTFGVTEGSPTLVISNVSAVHAGEYLCCESSSPERVISKIWLYTLDGESRKKESKLRQESVRTRFPSIK